MEHGSQNNPRASTFSITEEDHTLANSLRMVLNKDPRVSFCGYSIPHPSEARVNIQVQTTREPAAEVLKDGCQNLISMCEHVRRTLDDAVTRFKNNQPEDSSEDSPYESSMGNSSLEGMD